MHKLKGANIDIDLTSRDDVSWHQDGCPWNEAEQTDDHKCAVKNTSLCRYFRGIEYPDTVICCYPGENPHAD